MPTIGIIALLGAFMLGRQLLVGRGKETPTDIRDILTDILSGDWEDLSSVLSRRGGGSVGVGSGSVPTPTDSGIQSSIDTGYYSGSNALLNRMIALGHAAKGYNLGSTGPDYYDCSGLVWQAMKAEGVYRGSRFTTKNFEKALSGKVRQVSSPVTGDIVLWPNHHIGLVSGQGVCYSAMSRSNGIGFAKISDITKSVGVSPVYHRIVG